MSKVYFTSDPHIGHKNLCRNCRDMTAEESDKLIIDNWNKIITKQDKVYILGDITMERPELILSFLNQLNGRIVIIGGNHDDEKCCKVLAEANIPVVGCVNYKGYLCTHVPINYSELKYFKGNIHGHIHNSCDNYSSDILLGNYFNVNVEFNDYKPVLFSDIETYFENNKLETTEERILNTFKTCCEYYKAEICFNSNLECYTYFCNNKCEIVQKFKNNLKMFD